MNEFNKKYPSGGKDSTARWVRRCEFGSAQLVQAAGPKCSIISGLQSPRRDSFIFGRAFPCRCAPGDNLALHHSLCAAPKGTVIVCDAGGCLDVGYFGELMALDAKNRELAGLIIDGSVRDAGDLDAIGFPVFCAGYAPRQSMKRHPGSVGKPILLRGARVSEGDYVVADRDAVVIVRQEVWDDVRKQSATICSQEETIRNRLGSGEYLFDVLSLAQIHGHKR